MATVGVKGLIKDVVNNVSVASNNERFMLCLPCSLRLNNDDFQPVGFYDN